MLLILSCWAVTAIAILDTICSHKDLKHLIVDTRGFKKFCDILPLLTRLWHNHICYIYPGVSRAFSASVSFPVYPCVCPCTACSERKRHELSTPKSAEICPWQALACIDPEVKELAAITVRVGENHWSCSKPHLRIKVVNLCVINDSKKVTLAGSLFCQISQISHIC